MSLSHLLDTSVYSQPVKDYPAPGVLDRWSELGEAVVCTSAVCLAELLQGLEQRRSEKYWRRYKELLMGRYPVLPFDDRAAVHFGHLSAELRLAGQTRPVVDLMVAATCIGHGLTVVTLNVRHFAGIPGLKVEDWSPLASSSRPSR